MSRVRIRMPQEQEMASRSRDHLGEKVVLVLISGLLYSLAISSVSVASRYMSPLVLTTLRLATASAIFGVILFFTRPTFRWRLRAVVDIVVIGILNIGLAFLLLAISMHYISSSLAAVIFNVTPPMTVLLAHLMLPDEKLQLGKIAGTVVAVAGAVVLLTSNASGLSSVHSQGWIGQLLIIVASAANAFGLIYIRLRVRAESTTVLAAGQVFACLALFLPACLLIEGLPPLAGYPWQAWAAMLVASVSAPVIAFWLLFYMVNKFSASLGGFSGIATPLFSAAIGILFLGEVITLPIALGTVLVLAGIWTLNGY